MMQQDKTTLTHPSSRARPTLSRWQIVLFALAAGMAVGNLYWAQPLLAKISTAMAISPARAGALVTATQCGYALGILLLVPLGDSLPRQRLIPAILLCSALCLLACALAPDIITLTLAMGALGLSTVAGQLLTPLAGELAAPEQRGRVIGTLVSGMLSGILLSRAVSGLLADILGWHAIYFVAAALTALLAILLAQRLPPDAPRPALPYGALLYSVWQVVRDHRAAQITLILGALSFGVFSLFWTGLTFLLSAPPYGLATGQIGLVGLIGLAGALMARRAGRLHDSGHSVPATGAGLLLSAVALLLITQTHPPLWALLLAVLLLDIGIQTLNVLNQTRLLTLDAARRNRLNTAFVTCNFLGGAAGSLLAGTLWHLGGWHSLMLAGLLMLALALLVWTLTRRHLALIPGTESPS